MNTERIKKIAEYIEKKYGLHSLNRGWRVIYVIYYTMENNVTDMTIKKIIKEAYKLYLEDNGLNAMDVTYSAFERSIYRTFKSFVVDSDEMIVNDIANSLFNVISEIEKT